MSLVSGKKHTFLDMPRVGGQSDAGHSQKTFRDTRRHSRDFQAVEVLAVTLPQNALDRPADRLLLAKTEDRGIAVAGQAEKVPTRLSQFSAQSKSGEILNQSPAGEIGL